VTGIAAIALLYEHYSAPILERNDRTGLDGLLGNGTWLALAESLIIFLIGRAKTTAPRKEYLE